MRILIISPTQSGIGGIAQHIQGLSNFLKSNDHTVEIISSENTFTVPIKGLKNPSFMLSASLKAKFKKGNDIVHAFNIPSALSMKSSSGKKVLTIHGIFSDQIGILHGELSHKLSDKFEKEAFDLADAVTAGSKESYEHYSKLGTKVSHIPNAIDIESLTSEVDVRYEKQIIFAGRLSKEKGILTVLETAQDLPEDIHLIIIGKGPEENAVIEHAKKFTNTHFLGYQPKEKTISLIRGSKLLIQPSFVEGISTTLLESMSCKTPIIASNVGGNKELLIHNKTGVLIEPGNPKELLKEILGILDDSKRIDDITKSAYDEVQNYDWSNVGKLYLNLYEKLLG